MHTVYVIVGGLMLLGLFALFARALSDPGRTRRRRLLLAFVPVWLACATWNLWVGVSRAGYGLGEELPVCVVVFAVPAALALWLAHRAGKERA